MKRTKLKPNCAILSVSVWDHLGTEPVLNKMMSRVMKGRNAEAKDSLPLTPSLNKPHLLEQMISDSGLWCIRIDRGEYPLYLSSDEYPSSACAFDLVSLPIKETLNSLKSSGERPFAFEDARAAFDDIVSTNGGCIEKDSKGRFVIQDNRYKIMVARRRYEDGDASKESKKTAKSVSSKSDLKPQPISVPTDAISKFDDVLSESFSERDYSPMAYFDSTIKHLVNAEGHDAKSLKVMDLGSRPHNNKPALMLTSSFPDAYIHSADFSSELELADDMKSASEKGLDLGIVNDGAPPDCRLSSVPDGSIDIVTCAFGLSYFEDANAVMKQVHRVLKPGGSLVTATWDSISLEHISNRIMAKILGEHHAPYEFLNLAKFATPHKLEKLVEYNGLAVMKFEHHEFPFILAKDGIVDDNVFETAILPVRHILHNLQQSRSHPSALSDARKAFDELIEDGEFMSIDKHGNLITDPNRFSVLVARRLFEDEDRAGRTME